MAKHTKSALIRRTLPMHLQEIYEVVSSERYLCTNDHMEGPITTEITHTDYTVDDEGITHAIMHVRSTAEMAAGAANPNVENGQAVAVDPFHEAGFNMRSVIALPGGIGDLHTIIGFAPGGGNTTDVVAYVEVAIPGKAAARALTKQLLAASEPSIDKGLRRIEAFAHEASSSQSNNQA